MSNSTTHAPTAGRPIPAPADFPVSWENPDDAKLTWKMESHANVNVPMAPLIYSVLAACVRGMSSVSAQIGLPFHLRTAHINSYYYVAFVPAAAPPEAVMKAIGAVHRLAPGLVKLLMGRMVVGMTKQQLDRLNPILARFDVYWHDELLPEIKQHLAYFESCDLRGLSLEQLRAHFAESLKRVERMGGGLHMLAAIPAIFAMSQFEELYCDLFEGATPLDALRLLQGFDNKTLEGDRALWQLSRAALTLPGVHQALAECAAADVIPALEGSSEGRRFLADLRAYLNQFGRRLNPFYALNEPSWIEDPTTAIEYLKAYATRPNTDPEAEQARLAAGREKAIAEARARLAGYPQAIVTQFETLLKAAQTAVVVSEDHNYWIDQRGWYQMRRLALEFGRRLAETGVLGTADDVFYLTADELLDGGGGGLTPSVQQRVKERKAELAQFSRVTPPPMLGTMPPFELADGGPLFGALMKTELGPTGSNGSSQELKGQSGSPGVVRGIAKVVSTLAEAGKLQPGDVLVAKWTHPPWTPLFGIAAAVVTDTGGVLSHCAVVAREYHIPAVVGTGQATKTFHDGQLLEVDGNAGIVRVIVEEQIHEPALAG
jgi:phosphohistidine swiveling domain-containing protein